MFLQEYAIYLSLVALHVLLRGRHRSVGHPRSRPGPSHHGHPHGRSLHLAMQTMKTLLRTSEVV